ncbi:MAG TPA: alpha/beta hydrolase [Hyphomonadaceae bacterium]|nr:alpha/beta hydrolase [Hyphomonadaceae bacterium]
MAHDFRYVKSGDQTIRVAVEGSGPLVLMVHGFPESWSSFRHQMGPVAEAGFTAAAIDVRGYGGSSRPHAVEAYDMASIVADNQAVADQLGGGKAILVGRDWGAPIVWSSALIDPKRFTAVCGMSIPHMGHGSAPIIDIMRKLFTENGLFFYMVYFQDEGVAEKELERDVRDTIRRIYYAWSADAPPGGWPAGKKHGEGLLPGMINPEKFPAWLPDEDIDYMVGEFTQSGFRGPLNRYRNFHRDFALMSKYAGQKIEQPAMFMAGTADVGIRMFGRDVETRMRQHFDDLRGFHMIEGAGHWNQQEKPEETNGLLLGWLKGL